MTTPDHSLLAPLLMMVCNDFSSETADQFSAKQGESPILPIYSFLHKPCFCQGSRCPSTAARVGSGLKQLEM